MRNLAGDSLTRRPRSRFRVSGVVSLLGGGGVWPANGYLVLKVIKKAMEVEPPLDTQCKEKFKIQVMRLSPEERNMDRLDVVSALLSLFSFFSARKANTPVPVENREGGPEFDRLPNSRT